MMETPVCFRTPGAAAYLGISESTLNKWRLTDDAGPPWVKLGRSVVYLRYDLDAWLNANRRGASIMPTEAEAMAAA